MTNSGAWRGTGRDAAVRAIALNTTTATRSKRIQEPLFLSVYPRFRAFDVVDGRALDPHPKIARIAAAGQARSVFGLDLERLPFALHDSAIQLKIFSRRVLGIPGGREGQHRVLIGFVLQQFVGAAHEMRRGLDAFLFSGIL